MEARDSAIANAHNGQTGRHRLAEPMPSENLNKDAEKSAAMPSQCPPQSERPKRIKTGLYVTAKPSLQLRDRNVTRLAQKMRSVMPWLEPADWRALKAWAELEYLCSQIYAALRALGVLNERKEARRLLHDYRQLRQAQAVYANALGLTPGARMAIKANGTRAALDLAEDVTGRAVEIFESRKQR
jgi:hypothetical protein